MLDHTNMLACMCVCLVMSRHLSHGSQEALGVKEPSHPECIGPALEYPSPELLVPFEELRVPETNG